MELKHILKSLIKENGITVSSLSKKTQIPVQTLHNWLSGMEPRSLNQVKKVATYFDVTLDYLCFGIKNEITNGIKDHEKEINAGIFEVVLRRIKK